MTLKEIVTLPYPAKISHAIAGVLYYQIIAGDKAIVFPIDMNDRDGRNYYVSSRVPETYHINEIHS